MAFRKQQTNKQALRCLFAVNQSNGSPDFYNPDIVLLGINMHVCNSLYFIHTHMQKMLYTYTESRQNESCKAIISFPSDHGLQKKNGF